MKNSLRLNAASLWLTKSQSKLFLITATNLEWVHLENVVPLLKKGLKIVKNHQDH